jgi:hypothetical protein
MQKRETLAAKKAPGIAGNNRVENWLHLLVSL